MPILFHDFLKEKLDRPKPKGGTYWGTFSRLVDVYDNAPVGWVTDSTLKEIHRLRQLDKFEPAITYYLFSALVEATANMTDIVALTDLLKYAFPSEQHLAATVAQELARYHAGSLRFEAQIVPNKELRDKVKDGVDYCPVAYHRKIAAGRKRVRYESATKLACFVGDERVIEKNPKRRKGRFGLGVEAKFTSDIDDETTFSPHRNQIARTLEVGNQRAEQFVFLLIAPRCYRRAKSRLFVYKIEEYRSPDGVAALRRDIILTQPDDDMLARWIRHTGWLDWEHVVEFLYPNEIERAGWESDESEPLREFLKDRRLWPFG